MVSAAKYARAEKALQDGRPNGAVANGLSSSRHNLIRWCEIVFHHACILFIRSLAALFDKNNITIEGNADKQAIIIVSSDRGLCGGIHSGLAKAVKLQLKDTPTVP